MFHTGKHARALAGSSAAALGAATLGLTIAAQPASAASCGSGTAYAGPAIVAHYTSCYSLGGLVVTASGGYSPGASGWNSCVLHLSLRDDTVAGTPYGLTTGCGGSPTSLSFSHGIDAGHSYHVYAWVTGTWQGKSVSYGVANSPEFVVD